MELKMMNWVYRSITKPLLYRLDNLHTISFITVSPAQQ